MQPTTSVVYGVKADGTLWCYQHTFGGAFPSSWSYGVQVGVGWNVRQVFGGSGAVYAIMADGTLLWLKHDGQQTCSYAWQPAKVVGTGWQNFRSVVGTTDGVIYALQPNGHVLYYRHLGFADGSYRWQPDSGTRVYTVRDEGLLFTSGAGVVYWTPWVDPYLRWFRKLDASTAAIPGAPTGSGFETKETSQATFTAYRSMVGSKHGVVYGIAGDGRLHWQQHLDRFGPTDRFTAATPVGTGWNVFVHVFTAQP